MTTLSRKAQRKVIIAFLALERYLLNGGRDAEETSAAYAALKQAYRGPSEPLVNRFADIGSGAEEGTWMAELRIALEGELDRGAWSEAAERELNDRTTVDPDTR